MQWSDEAMRPEMMQYITNHFKDERDRQIESLKQQINRMDGDLHDYRRAMKRLYDQQLMAKKRLSQEQSAQDEMISKLKYDMDKMINLEKIIDVEFQSGKFVFHTTPIYARDDDGNRYYMGNYKVTVDMKNSDVKFISDNPRRGFWSYRDNHPHVSESGSGCLGNASDTIAMLCSDLQLYPLATILIDYLESVNLNDPAGAMVKFWDMVDEEGNIIQHGYPEDYLESDDDYEYTCNRCDGGCNETYTVFDEVRMGVDEEHDRPTGEHTVCEGCEQDYYTYVDALEERIENAGYNQYIRNYREREARLNREEAEEERAEREREDEHIDRQAQEREEAQMDRFFADIDRVYNQRAIGVNPIPQEIAMNDAGRWAVTPDPFVVEAPQGGTRNEDIF